MFWDRDSIRSYQVYNLRPNRDSKHMTLQEGKTLSSPNAMVWNLFEALRRLCGAINQQDESSDIRTIRQDSAICILLAVQCVEVFLNVYFRVVVSEKQFAHAANKIVSDLENPRFALDRKIKEWPKDAFGQSIDFSGGAGQRFLKLKKQRNQLMHFKSTHESIELENVAIHGLADTSFYSSLNLKSATAALQTAEDFLCSVFAVRGISDEDIPHALHSWSGKLPDF